MCVFGGTARKWGRIGRDLVLLGAGVGVRGTSQVELALVEMGRKLPEGLGCVTGQQRVPVEMAWDGEETGGFPPLEGRMFWRLTEMPPAFSVA